jgi:transcriptional regulator with XRE-family HTH domain
MINNSKNCQEYINELGTKLKQYRVNAGLTQQELEDKSGVSARSISRLEQGHSVQLDSLIRVLMALGLGQNIELLIPDQTKRPSYYLDSREKNKSRVRKKANTAGGFKWGDEE